MDIVVRGATIADGTGNPGFRADLGIKDGRIAAIGDKLTGTRTIDAAGLVVAPGFIDMHSLSDLQMLAAPEHLAKVSQGVTLEVLGQDGLSYAPVDDRTLPQLRNRLAGRNGDAPDVPWRSVSDYLDVLDRGMAVNAVYLVPHGNVRMLVMGW